MGWHFQEKKNVRKFGNTTQSCRLFGSFEKKELKKEAKQSKTTNKSSCT